MKARFKTVLITAFSTLTAFSSLTLTSCNNDKCQAIACANSGICEEGRCTCAAGYEGYQCETENRKRYLGIWYVSEDGTISTAAQYPVSVERVLPNAGGATELKITNFRNSFTQPVRAFVSADTITIPVQTINGNTIQGRGVLIRNPASNGNYSGVYGQLTLRYSVKDNNENVDNFGYGTGNPSIWNK